MAKESWPYEARRVLPFVETRKGAWRICWLYFLLSLVFLALHVLLDPFYGLVFVLLLLGSLYIFLVILWMDSHESW